MFSRGQGSAWLLPLWLRRALIGLAFFAGSSDRDGAFSFGERLDELRTPALVVGRRGLNGLGKRARVTTHPRVVRIGVGPRL